MKLYRVTDVLSRKYGCKHNEVLVKAETFGNAIKEGISMLIEIEGENRFHYDIELLHEDVDSIQTITGE